MKKKKGEGGASAIFPSDYYFLITCDQIHNMLIVPF